MQKINGIVDTNKTGTYTLTYTITSSNVKSTTSTRTFIVSE